MVYWYVSGQGRPDLLLLDSFLRFMTEPLVTEPYFSPLILTNSKSNKGCQTAYHLLIQGRPLGASEEVIQKLKNRRQQWFQAYPDSEQFLKSDWQSLPPLADIHNLSIQHSVLTQPIVQHLLAIMGLGYAELSAEPIVFDQSIPLSPKFVGIVNLSQDSFSDGGKWKSVEKAVDQMIHLWEAGAAVIELGAQSTAPGRVLVGEDAEYQLLISVIECLRSHPNGKEIRLGVDTIHPTLALRLINECHISWINDVLGYNEAHILAEMAERGSYYCRMHSLSIPPSQAIRLSLHLDPITYLREWAEQTLEQLIKLGFKRDKLILDPGIGFNKNPYQSLEIMHRIGELSDLGCALMVGHSRKGCLQRLTGQTLPADRDPETLALSLVMKDKVDYLRVHDVAGHVRGLVIDV